MLHIDQLSAPGLCLAPFQRGDNYPDTGGAQQSLAGDGYSVHHPDMSDTADLPPKRIQVALSGSGFLLPVHVGALQAIEAAGYTVSVLSGTSGGAIVAALYAVQQDANALAELVLTTDWAPFMDFASWTNGWRLLTRRGICATAAALDTFLIQQTEGRSFADLPVELLVCATNLRQGERQVFSRSATPDLPIATAARASASLPFVYPPKRIGKTLYVDGGLTDNIPGNLLLKDSGTPAVGVYLTGTAPQVSDQAPTLFALASLSVRDLLHGQEYLDRHAAPCVRFVAVDTGNLNMLDTRMSRDTRTALMRAGYDRMQSLLAEMAHDKPTTSIDL